EKILLAQDRRTPIPRLLAQQKAAVRALFFLVRALSQERTREYLGLIYAARLGAQDDSVQQRERAQARDATMLSFLLSEGLNPTEVEMLYIIGAAITPSIIGLTLCFISLLLPDDGQVLSKPSDDQRGEPQRAQDAEDSGDDWRRAA